jgi:DNA repair protein RecO (recombination protein O)
MMKRGLYKTEAVVLNSFDYGESDRILAFYTSGFGKLKGIAKGARRSRKRFVNNLDPGCRITLIFFHSEKSELVRVEDATLIEGLAGLSNDIELLSRAYYILELTSEMTREGQAMSGVYPLLAAFLGMLAAPVGAGGAGGAEDPATLLRFFEMKLLSHAGYLPHLDECVVCRGAISPAAEPGAHAVPLAPPSRRLFFSSELGGVVCAGCRPITPVRGSLIDVSPGTARLLSKAAKLEHDKLSRLKAAPGFAEESERLLDDFIRHQIRKELKTKTFLNKLRSAFT